MKPRNHELALVAKNDPGRFRTRRVEDESGKEVQKRSRRKERIRDAIDETLSLEDDLTDQE